MGNNLAHEPETVPITEHVLEELESKSVFDQHELLQLWKRFQAIGNALTPDGLIDRTEFQQSLGYFNSNALIAHRLFHVFDQDGDGTINFHEFVSGLSQICSDDHEAKTECTLFLFFGLVFPLPSHFLLMNHLIIMLFCCL